MDVHTHGILDYGAVQSLFTCSSLGARYQQATLIGSSGRIEIETPFTPPNESCLLKLYQGSRLTEIRIEGVDQYRCQVEQFGQSLQEGQSTPYAMQDALKHMMSLDALKVSARQGQWINLR